MKTVVSILGAIGGVGVCAIAWMLVYIGPHYGFLSDTFLTWQIVVFPATFIPLIIAERICAYMVNRKISRRRERK